MTDAEIIERLKRDLGAEALEVTNPDRRRIFLKVGPGDLVAAVTLLRDKYDCAYLATISGLDKGEAFEILYHFASPAANINVRTEIPKASPHIDSITRRHPRGHPLRAGAPGHVRPRRRPPPGPPPPRHAGRLAGRELPSAQGLEVRAAAGDHPRRQVMKFQIPIGPQHPALKEPISLRMTVEGEVIQDADIRLGYNHRGLEKLAEEKTWIQNIYLTERICGICSHSHATCFVQGVEKLMEIVPPKRGLYIRYLVSELERVHSHLLWLGVAGHEAGFDSFFMYTWRDREIVMDLLELISGNRVHYAINTLGGVRRDIDEGQKAKILEGVVVLRKRSEYYFHIGANEPSFVGRIAGVGPLTKEQAVEPLRRRPHGPGLGHHPGRPQGRPLRRLRRDALRGRHGRHLRRPRAGSSSASRSSSNPTRSSSRSSRTCPPATSPSRRPGRPSPNEVVSRYEAPRGENMHYIKSNGTDKPERLKVRAPTLANYPATVEMLRHGFIADIPLIFAAIDPCICCAERTVSLVNARSGEETTVRLSDLRRRAIEHHKTPPLKRNAVWPF